jgi:hypothetical protein
MSCRFSWGSFIKLRKYHIFLVCFFWFFSFIVPIWLITSSSLRVNPPYVTYPYVG